MEVLSGRQYGNPQALNAVGWGSERTMRIPSQPTSPPTALRAFALVDQPTSARITAALVDNSSPWDCAKTTSGAAKAAPRRDKAVRLRGSRGQRMKANPRYSRGCLGLLTKGQLYLPPIFPLVSVIFRTLSVR